MTAGMVDVEDVIEIAMAVKEGVLTEEQGLEAIAVLAGDAPKEPAA